MHGNDMVKYAKLDHNHPRIYLKLQSESPLFRQRLES